jgi:hypothetical protein
MKTNMGSADRAIRIFIAIILAGLYFSGLISGTIGVILLVVAIVFLLTSIIGFCGLYTIFGMNTCPRK